MTTNNKYSIAFGICLSLITISVYHFIRYMQEFFDLFGIDELIKPESRDYGLIKSSILAIIIVMLIAILLRLINRKYMSIGFSIILIPETIYLLTLGVRYCDKTNYYQTFEKNIWLTEMPIKMIRQLINSHELIGKNKAQIETKLGKSNTNVSKCDSTIIYRLDKNFFGLVLMMQEDTVIESYISVDD